MILNFSPITSQDIPKILPYFDLRSNKTCDSVFLDVFLWKDYYNVKFATIKKPECLFLTMEIDNQTFSSLPICKVDNLNECFNILKDYFNQNLNKKLQIYLGDEEGVKSLNLNTSFYNIYEVEDAKDYIYSAESLKTLKGKKLRKKKNHINAFLKEHEGHYEYKSLNCSNKEEIWEFLIKWRDLKGEDAEEHLDGEIYGIKSILDNCSLLKISMAGIYIKNELQAFTLGSLNQKENMAIIHIEKANPNIRGLYPFINQQFIINNYPNVTLVNREDDLGIEGLRKAKLSYEPIDFAKKYRIIQL